MCIWLEDYIKLYPLYLVVVRGTLSLMKCLIETGLAASDCPCQQEAMSAELETQPEVLGVHVYDW